MRRTKRTNKKNKINENIKFTDDIGKLVKVSVSNGCNYCNLLIDIIDDAKVIEYEYTDLDGGEHTHFQLYCDDCFTKHTNNEKEYGFGKIIKKSTLKDSNFGKIPMFKAKFINRKNNNVEEEGFYYMK